jgi:hypothetical protein
MKKLIAAVFLITATSAQANELDAMLRGLDQTEVSFRGEIGYARNMNTDIYIKTENMSRPIYGQLALNREQLASIQGCELRETRCDANIQAELTFSEGQITAVIFDVSNVISRDLP